MKDRPIQEQLRQLASQVTRFQLQPVATRGRKRIDALGLVAAINNHEAPPMKASFLSVLVLALALGACADASPPAVVYQPQVYRPAPAPPFSPQTASRLLKPNMTEDDVVRTLGAEPSQTSLVTCGTALKSKPWQCKNFFYGDMRSQVLMVTFERDPSMGGWVVNSWKVIG